MEESDPTVLIVKHFPAELTFEDREELLKIFGAKAVRCMPDNGKLKYTAFATFETNREANHGLSKLHQLEILNRKLVVEFAKKRQQDEFPKQGDFQSFKPTKPNDGSASKIADKEKLRQEALDFSKHLHGTCPALGLDYLPSPLLKYNYPKPTPSIIANISHALVAVPRFYTQVLHLMNKMNLPAPFGPVTPAPPLNLDQALPLQDRPVEDQYSVDNTEVTEMDTSSEEESELESDEDAVKTNVVVPSKRPTTKLPKQRKKPKFHQLMAPISSLTTKAIEQHAQPADVFEIQPAADTRKIQFNIKPTLEADQENNDSVVEEMQENISFSLKPKSEQIDVVSSKEIPEEDWVSTDFISRKELREKRISESEMKTLSAFKNYTPGEPSVRLYIKNLARQVDEKDLRYIFGRFVDQSSEIDKNMFDVRLMKEGRMKGQAFITLANEKQAISAVKHTNGYVLHTKPLVVQFARSAKPKETSEKQKGKKS